MRHFALAALLAFGNLSLSLPAVAQNVDASALPDYKRSRLQLYMSPREALEIIGKEPTRTLFLDVRTRAEAMYVGMPTVADALVPYVEHQELMTDWDERRHMYQLEPNSDFIQEAEIRLKEKSLTKADRVILICRSGDRSARAADLLANAGFTRVYSITEGFEGDSAKDGPKAGQRIVNGWKNAGLPWTYKLEKAKMYFPR
ncbi:rhodanese-like domain-containing protein [Zoogloea sp.]|uniref:rhodanese-like domain-containing protein n=1 Tax=Zoogloea sp. TaxID=49181 RepID=UPI0025D4FD82|nr:rhodanese-like domain-containing protein [Zoogloea sp.]MCK6395830.1 sulfurtransferase [Zoogloea sp.]